MQERAPEPLEDPSNTLLTTHRGEAHGDGHHSTSPNTPRVKTQVGRRITLLLWWERPLAGTASIPRPLQRECSQEASAIAPCHTVLLVIILSGWVHHPIHCAHSFVASDFVWNAQMPAWPQHTSAMFIAMDGSCGDVHLRVNHGPWTVRDSCVPTSILSSSGCLGSRNTTLSLTAGWDPCADELSPSALSSSSLMLPLQSCCFLTQKHFFVFSALDLKLVSGKSN